MIAIGDVHGCYDTLMALIKKLPDKQICFVGDLIDRGPKSKEVLEFVFKHHMTVLGNHEDMMLMAMDKGGYYEKLWTQYGGKATLKSLSFKDRIYYASKFEKLPYTFQYKNFVVSHSNAACPITEHDKRNWTIWNRDFTHEFNDGRINVFGHTPVSEPTRYDNQILIDTSCSGHNMLTAYDMDTDTFYCKKAID